MAKKSAPVVVEDAPVVEEPVVETESTVGPEAEHEIEPADYLMWVGSVFYPTVDTYIEEARRLGVCKRLGRVARNLVPGKSRVFLAHDDGLIGEGFIFGYFIPSQIQFLAADEADIPENLTDRVVWLGEWSTEEARECGDRREGAYAVCFGEESQTPSDGFVVFDKPRSLEAFDPDRKHFRGLLKVGYGDKVIKAKKAQTMVPPSRKAKEPIPANTPWTSEDDELIVTTIEQSKSMSNGAQKLAYMMGRPKNSILYRYAKISGRLDEDGGEEETE